MGLADGATEVHKVTLAREILKGYQGTDDLFPTRHIPRLRAEAEARYAEVLARHGGPSKRHSGSISQPRGAATLG
jgi:acyl-CoA dehydrogenase